MLTEKRMRQIVIAFIVLVIALAGWAGFNFIRHHGLVKTRVMAVPVDSIITLDGQETKGGTLYLKPGDHTFVATHNLFEDDTEKINTKDVSSTEIIYLLPKPVSAAALAYLQANPKVQAAREEAGGANAARAQRIVTTKYPIVSKLPTSNAHYKIDYAVTTDANIEFTVTLYAIVNRPSQYAQYQVQLVQYKAEALKFLKDNGVDTSAHKINFEPNV